MNRVHPGRRVLRRDQALRPHLQGAHRPAEVHSRHADLRGLQRRRLAPLVLVMDMYARPNEARRRLDERVRRAVRPPRPDRRRRQPPQRPEAPGGEPTLLTFDEVTTAFHEFGHALHGMFSDVKYPRFAGTNVPRDFVEFPRRPTRCGPPGPRCSPTTPSTTRPASPSRGTPRQGDVGAKFNQGFATTELPRRQPARPGLAPAEGRRGPVRRRRARLRGRRPEKGRRGLRARAAALPQHLFLAHLRPATTTPPATTRTSGARCSMPTPWSGSRQNGGLTREERRPLPRHRALPRQQRRGHGPLPQLPRRRTRHQAPPRTPRAGCPGQMTAGGVI
jgi:hypothetical protein